MTSTGPPRVLVLDGLFDDLDVEAEAASSVGWEVQPWDGEAAAFVDARVVVHVRTQVDRDLLGRMPHLQVVGRFGTGLDTVDLQAARDLGVAVVGVRDYCIPELTTHTLGLAFALDRRIDRAGSGQLGPDVAWQAVSTDLPIPGRVSATVVGFGTIGRSVSAALLACGLDVRVVSGHGAGGAVALGARMTDLDEGLRGAGYVFLHAALTEATRGLIDAGKLARMSPGTILVDTARIGLIDEQAVADAIRGGHLGGLALDARLSPASPLRALLDDPRLLLTPHIGWYSARSAHDLRRRTILASIAAAEGRVASASVDQQHKEGDGHDDDP